MEKEKAKGNFALECFNTYLAKMYVYARKNIFAKWTRRYIFQSCPAIIKEIVEVPDGSKAYWFWCFLPNKKIIYMFNRKPTKKQIKLMVEDFNKEKKGK